MRKGTIILKALIATVIFGAIYFYAVFPPINLQDEGFYFFLIVLIAVFFVAYNLLLRTAPRGGHNIRQKHI